MAQTPRTQETRVLSDMIAEKARGSLAKHSLLEDGFHLDLYQTVLLIRYVHDCTFTNRTEC
jgi:hypothetical protein